MSAMANKKKGDDFEKRVRQLVREIVEPLGYEVPEEPAKRNLRYAGRIDETTGKTADTYGMFETDVVVTTRSGDQSLPLVVVETKTRHNTDAILAYARKAEMHRLVYPWLRYGFVLEVNDRPNLTAKDMWHGRGFDFMLFVSGLSEAARKKRLKRIIRREIGYAEGGREVLAGDHLHPEYPEAPLGPRFRDSLR